MHVKKLSLLVTVFTLLLGAIATETARAESMVESFNEPILLAQRTTPREPKVRGVVKSVVGTQVLVELDRAQDQFLWVGVPQAQLGSLNLMGGTPVFLEGNKIVSLAPHSLPVPPRSSNFSSRIQSLWSDYERSLDRSPSPSTVSLPFDSTPATIPGPATTPVPIQGLW
ncbi:hypothetical protein [Spirulina sp. 06S082]|uniref:hypothetical protein n=1 Tax=Spirulina sp. 06S082 TaxID=3110248 RepID=UPI002B21FED2|nr:hypothetical protein [Spirulina sp. 06S082]MEA5468755.1 hypothetical protein [Spirulina sp. 06S082]